MPETVLPTLQLKNNTARMYIKERLHQLLVLTLPALLVVLSACEAPAPTDRPVAEDDPSPFIGQWTFDIGNWGVGWLDIREDGGFLDADLMWGFGGIDYSVPYTYVSGNTLFIGRNPRRVVQERDAQGEPAITSMFPAWIQIYTDGDQLTGYHLSPKNSGVGLDTIRISGRKAPPMPPPPDLSAVEFGQPINLIKDPNSLEGWHLIERNLENGWHMENGILFNDPVQVEGQPTIRYGNLRTDQEFEDFHLALEVNVPPRGNSGVYLRGMYEIQISDSYNRPLNWGGSMGAVFTRTAPTVNAEKPAGEWQDMEITFVDRHVTVVLNGVTILENVPVPGPTGGASQSDITAPGPIYLQGDHTAVSYRNMVLTPVL